MHAFWNGRRTRVSKSEEEDRIPDCSFTLIGKMKRGYPGLSSIFYLCPSALVFMCVDVHDKTWLPSRIPQSYQFCLSRYSTLVQACRRALVLMRVSVHPLCLQQGKPLNTIPILVLKRCYLSSFLNLLCVCVCVWVSALRSFLHRASTSQNRARHVLSICGPEIKRTVMT